MLTSIEDLKTWFLGNQRPYFTLYVLAGGSRKNIVARNTTEGDMDAAWKLLELHVTIQTKAAPVTMELITGTGGDKLNNPFTTEIRINPFSIPGNPALMHPGIAGFGMNYPGVQSIGFAGIQSKGDLDEYLAGERKKWELEKRVEDLENAQSDDVEKWEKVLDKINESPALSGVIQMIAGRVLGGGTMPASVGSHAPPAHYQPTQPAENPVYDDDTDHDTEYEQEMTDLMNATDMSDLELVKRINAFRKNDPTTFGVIVQQLKNQPA